MVHSHLRTEVSLRLRFNLSTARSWAVWFRGWGFPLYQDLCFFFSPPLTPCLANWDVSLVCIVVAGVEVATSITFEVVTLVLSDGSLSGILCFPLSFTGRTSRQHES